MSNGMLAYLGALLGGGQNNTQTGDEELMYVNFVENDGVVTADKTYSEVVAAIESGKIVIGTIVFTDGPFTLKHFLNVQTHTTFADVGASVEFVEPIAFYPDDSEDPSHYEATQIIIDMSTTGIEKYAYEPKVKAYGDV